MSCVSLVLAIEEKLELCPCWDIDCGNPLFEVNIRWGAFFNQLIIMSFKG